MNIGVKYCGGCNPLYNRSEYVKELQKQRPSDSFFFAGEGCFDKVYVVCGCERMCPSISGLEADSFIFVSNTGEYPDRK